MRLKTFDTRMKVFETNRVKAPPKEADPELGTAAHKRFRQIVCDRAGWRCEWVENGKRCEASRERGDVMIADHKKERKDGGDPFDPENGQCLCVSHNTRKGREAGRERAKSSFGMA